MSVLKVLLSAKRKSTDGFAIGPVLCDFAGGILSTAQQVPQYYMTACRSLISALPMS